MTEQEKQNSKLEIKKKPCIASRIVWLAWVGILLLLLVAGLFFSGAVEDNNVHLYFLVCCHYFAACL